MKVKQQKTYTVKLSAMEASWLAHMLNYARQESKWSGEAHATAEQFINETIGAANLHAGTISNRN